MEKLKLEKVNSKKQLEAQGYFKIESNDGWFYFADEPDKPKYVLCKNETNDFYAEKNKSLVFESGGDVLHATPVWSIKEALDIYNSGIYHCPKYDKGDYLEISNYK